MTEYGKGINIVLSLIIVTEEDSKIESKRLTNIF